MVKKVDVLNLPTDLTHAQATACAQLLRAAVAAQPAQATVVLDASALQQFDSSALAVLLDVQRACVQSGRTLQVQGLSAPLRDLAVLYGIDGLLQAA